MMFFLIKKMDSRLTETTSRKTKSAPADAPVVTNLEKLVKLQKELKAKTIDRELTQLNFYDRTSKLFKPITNTIEKGTKDINKI